MLLRRVWLASISLFFLLLPLADVYCHCAFIFHL